MNKNKYTQLKLPFPGLTFSQEQVVELLSTNSLAVQRAICRLASMLVEQRIKISDFKEPVHAEMCVRYARWIKGMNNRDQILYEAKSLDKSELLSDKDVFNLDRLFSKYCENNETVLDSARRVCFQFTQVLADYANEKRS